MLQEMLNVALSEGARNMIGRTTSIYLNGIQKNKNQGAIYIARFYNSGPIINCDICEEKSEYG